MVTLAKCDETACALPRRWICSIQYVLAAILVTSSFVFAQQTPSDETRKQIAQLEKQLKALPDGVFNWDLHNGLRHHYAGFDERKSMSHVEEILKHQPLDAYMRQCLGGSQADRSESIRSLLSVAKKHRSQPNLVASCYVWMAELEPDAKASEQHLKSAKSVKGITPSFIELIDDRLLFNPERRVAWPESIRPPKGLEKSPGPWTDPSDKTVWPNTESRANGDAWLIKNHDSIRKMKPRLLLINFSNEHDRGHLDQLTEMLIHALAESTRYHGYADENAPAFLNYEIFKFVDLRDKDRTVGNSRLMPAKKREGKGALTMKYRDLFTETFAQYYGVSDPRNPKRFLRLDELLDGGYIHEVWFFDSGNDKLPGHVGAFEVVEEKPKYNEQFQPVGREWVQAGNGGDNEQPWVGRSCRIGYVNASRGIGCFLESLAHGMEGAANSGSIPYFTKYFREYADFNLDTRYGLPFNSLYGVNYGGKPVQFLDEKTALITHGDKVHRVENYIPVGGSAHFPPNGRSHYDLDNDKPVLCTMADWRIGSGVNGTDKAEPYTRETIRNYRDMAPDCMGAWLIYWRQNMPGLDNKQKADDGAPMKNWWPFLFY
jgi:hypothetical protein